ncbi:hypothetical protein PLICRDRAFT_90865 [Plicaturopsis crispa FD-325 SS-3]|nr:hypothetical protein PLICRDRAFT_90865 [Plicaturopsis crispa FD-325 SS-3]
MAPREPTKHQISSRLSYSQNTPSFLLKLQNRMAGLPDEDEEDPEFEDDGSGRPPIPRRPAIPERPDDEAGSEDEDDGDEKPQVVVLKAGKHLTSREAENERRREKGLPALPDPSELLENAAAAAVVETDATTAVKPKQKSEGLSFSSSKSGSKTSAGKRKAIGTGDVDDDHSSGGAKPKKHQKKKAKTGKTLLSFSDDV